MTQEFASILSQGAGTLFQHIEKNPKTANELMLVAVLLRQLAADVDGYSASCLKQASWIKEILRKASEIMPPEQRSRVEAITPPAPATPDDYHSRHLGTYLSRLKIALVEVHAWLETAEAPARHDLLDEIWTYLESQAKDESRLMGQMW